MILAEARRVNAKRYAAAEETAGEAKARIEHA
jgi:hypothetical protein